MSSKPALDDQEPQSVSDAAPMPPPRKESSRRSMGAARRELSDKEFVTPAVQKMLLDDIDRLEREQVELSGFRTKFHDADKKAAILQEKNRLIVSQEIVSYFVGALGGAALGYAPSVWNSAGGGGGLALSIGLGLLVIGAIAKVARP